jgi:hypothetical protein
VDIHDKRNWTAAQMLSASKHNPNADAKRRKHERRSLSPGHRPFQLFDLRAILRSLFQLLLRSLLSSRTSAQLNVSESGRGLPVLMAELFDVLVLAVVDSHGSGSCMARKPETKHPPYA